MEDQVVIIGGAYRLILTVNTCRLLILRKEGQDGKRGWIDITGQLLMPIGSIFIPTLV